MVMLYDKFAEGRQFGMKMDKLTEFWDLARLLPLLGCKRNNAYYANNVNYANYVKHRLTKFGGLNYETCNLS